MENQEKKELQIIRVSGESELMVYSNSPTGQVAIIRDALESKMVNTISDHELFEELKRLYFLIHLEINWKLPEDDNDIVHACNSVIRHLRRNPKNIRKNELEIALINGIHRQYGDFMGISAVSISYFIDGYVKDQNRAEALRIRNQPPPVGKKPTANEIFEMAKQNTLEALKSFLQFQDLENKPLYENPMGRFASPAFDFLFQQKILWLTQDQIDSYFEKANEIYLAGLYTKKNLNTDPVKKISLANDIAGFLELSELAEKSKSEKQTIQAAGIVKWLALNYYFAFELEPQTVENLAELIEQSRTLKIN